MKSDQRETVPDAPRLTLNGAEAALHSPSSGERMTALVHLYRAEVGRAVRWRSRLDVTTNWAVLTTGAGMTFALGDREPQRHVLILLTSLLVTFFLALEARRYRHYDLWQHRVRILEQAFYAPLLDPQGIPQDSDWQATLAADLRNPTYHISFIDALGWRLRRNYVWLYLANLLTWSVKISIHPYPISTLEQFLMRVAIGPMPGWLVLLIGVIFNGTLFALMVQAVRRLARESDIMRC